MYKKISLKIAIILIATLIVTLLIPSVMNKTSAVSMVKPILGISTGSLEDGEVSIYATFLKNNFVFCSQLGQALSFGDRGTISYTVTEEKINGQENGQDNNVLNGLAYILNQKSIRDQLGLDTNDTAWVNFQNDPIQLALWYYMNQYNVNDILEENTNTSNRIKLENDKIIATDSTGNVWGNNEYGEVAAGIYINAKKIADGNNNNKYYSASVYMLNNNNYQQLMVVKTTSEQEEKHEVILKFLKTDILYNSLVGADIEIIGENNVQSIITNLKKSTSMWGYMGSITVLPETNNGEFKLKIAETVAPKGYKGLPTEVTLTVKFDTSTGEVVSVTPSDSTYIEWGNASLVNKNRLGYENLTNPWANGNAVIIKNEPKAVNLTINKTDSFTKQALEGARFKIQLTNAGSIEGYEIAEVGEGEEQNPPTVVYVTTDANGQINLTGVVPADSSKSITATITEVEVPTANGGFYYKPIDPITITITYNNGSWEVSGEGATISGNNATINIENQPNINISGMVWEDGQIGDKVISGPNGIRDEYYKYEKVADGEGNYIKVKTINDLYDRYEEVEQGKGNYIKVETIKEKGLEGVVVGLKRVSDNKIIKTRITDSNGTYTFTDVPYLGNTDGYQVIFAYDGINYEATDKDAGTDDTKDSDVTDNGRTEFNNKFKSISKGIATSSTGETIPLKYDEADGKSTLKVGMDGTNPANVVNGKTQTDFQIRAETETTYTITTENVDCGLVRKEFDLAIGTEVKSAKLEINDKSTEYTYAQIMNGEMEDLTLDDILQNNSSDIDIKYNLYLYTSDYNYRIKDYQTGIKNTLNSEDNTVNNYDNLKELEAYVTYSVILKNQTTHNAAVEQFVYYYDQAYTPQFNVGDTIDGYKIVSIENNKITFENAGENNVLSKDNSYSKEVILTFKVNENEAGNITTKTATNVAEITKYSTDIGGLIDKDSAPGNANVTLESGTPKVGQDEDDTDEAKGINISLRTESRTITGTVFEDTKKEKNQNYNGKKDDSEKGVNDVIVQLIEIKQINGKYYEYIWQETRSGSNTVKTTARNGYEGTTYTNSVQTGSGQYEFKDFIPGNYIIRFIYGDGSTYDLTNNVKTYNGQDYKSTIDTKYNVEWYNTAGYTARQSVARDNEARRLEVMAYSATVDKTNGADLANKTKVALDKTWMAAETSRINVPVDAENTATENDFTGISYENIGNTLSFDNINFGLALRPQTKLVLEKHITGLIITPKITPAGTGVQSIINAKATNIENIVNGKTVEISGVTDGLTVIYANRDNRGFWQVATDVEELMQGAELEVEYTYVIRNDGEKDYLSSTLVEAYENQDAKPYGEVLNEIKTTVKGTMRNGTYSYSDNNNIGQYLGQYYYNGNSTNCAEVSSRIETLEEAINNDLIFDEAINNDLIFDEGTDFTKVEGPVDKQIYDKDGNLVNKNINTVVQSTSSSKFLTPKAENAYTEKTADWSKTITLRKTLASESGGELGANLPSYIAEITAYSNAAGRRDMSSEPENLSYVHSEDNRITLDTYKDGNTYYQMKNGIIYKLDATNQTDYEKTDLTQIPDTAIKVNENDEFWAETIIITKPTGEDKLTPLQIAIITISSIAVIAVGIVLIKKFVLKK